MQALRWHRWMRFATKVPLISLDRKYLLVSWNHTCYPISNQSNPLHKPAQRRVLTIKNTAASQGRASQRRRPKINKPLKTLTRAFRKIALKSTTFTKEAVKYLSRWIQTRANTLSLAFVNWLIATTSRKTNLLSFSTNMTALLDLKDARKPNEWKVSSTKRRSLRNKTWRASFLRVNAIN